MSKYVIKCAINSALYSHIILYMLFMELDAPVFIFFNDVIFIFLIKLLNDLGLKQSTGAAKVTKEAVVMLLNPMKLEPLGHEADLCLDVML